MKREIIKINEDLCNGCGLCIPNCHEGALQIIDGKARLISDLMCDGLGACIGYCPEGAISIEQRKAEPYNEAKVMADMIHKGKNTVVAHFKHLLDHNETGFLKEGIEYMEQSQANLSFTVEEVLDEIYSNKIKSNEGCNTGGCPGSKPISFKAEGLSMASPAEPRKQQQASQLGHWPVQLHLINPAAAYFKKADLLIAADCTAFTMGDFHSTWLKNKSVVIACPKLDSGIEVYINKIAGLIDEAMVNTITVLMMEVPCCGGLLRIVNEARQMTSRNVPVKAVVVSTKGAVLREEWV
ncbi:MAG: 4Fe-4S binding protein [Prolixibacteraceae bacterium]|nr:4Fe-4S binding protein [Prolixibacteraceae bacterium]MBN2649558.1 4Fe-4S binding protein [Prolixibacteraceae bacterium]